MGDLNTLERVLLFKEHLLGDEKIVFVWNDTFKEFERVVNLKGFIKLLRLKEKLIAISLISKNLHDELREFPFTHEGFDLRIGRIKKLCDLLEEIVVGEHCVFVDVVKKLKEVIHINKAYKNEIKRWRLKVWRLTWPWLDKALFDLERFFFYFDLRGAYIVMGVSSYNRRNYVEYSFKTKRFWISIPEEKVFDIVQKKVERIIRKKEVDKNETLQRMVEFIS